MLRKPWPIVIMAFIYILAPVGNALISAILEKLPLSTYMTLLFRTHSTWELAQIGFLFPIAGIAIFMVKKWSIPVFLGVSGWSLYSNFMEYSRFPQVYTVSVLIVAVIVNLGFVIYFLIPAVRAAYLDPRLRWWESKPRYEANIQTKISGSASLQSELISDISEGGVFIKTENSMELDSTVTLNFEIEKVTVNCSGRVAHHIPGKGYGIQFDYKDSSDKGNVKAIVHYLEKSGAKRRPEKTQWAKDLWKWTTTLFTTGRGLIPQVPKK